MRQKSQKGNEPAGEGDVVSTERGHWHGFNNTSNDEVILVRGWSGAGSLESAGYEVLNQDMDSHHHE